MKIVTLNSGGFDSVVLAHYLRAQYPEAEIHCLFFDYGQRSKNLEHYWSVYHAAKIKA